MFLRKISQKTRNFISATVSGIISGGADNDPAGISTYAISGATTGYSQIWLMILATPMLIAVQSMCARIGNVKKKGLTKIIKDNFSLPLAFFTTFLLILANTITIGADLLGMSAALTLVTGLNYFFWIIPVSLFIWYIVVFKTYKTIVKYLLWLMIFFFAYIFAAFLSKPDWSLILKEIFFPKISPTLPYWAAATGLLGTTITPYLFFWQTKEEIEEGKPLFVSLEKAKREEILLAPGFIFSNLISVFIMIATAATLFGRHDLKTAADAALALEPLAGSLAKFLFAVGIIGSGLLAIPVLSSSTAYTVAELFNWRDSLSSKLSHAKGFYFTLSLSILIGIIIAFSNIDPLKALFYSQILDGILGPFLIVLILKIANDKKIMGKYTNSRFDNVFGYLAVGAMIISSLFLFREIAR